MDGRRIVLFDGVCNLCNSSVRFLIKIDRKKTLTFAHLQSDFAANNLPHQIINDSKLDSVIYFKYDKIYVKSAAFLEICYDIGYPWRLLYVFNILPASFLDIIYDFIAGNRYRWFGRKQECLLPSGDLLDRFIK